MPSRTSTSRTSILIATAAIVLLSAASAFSQFDDLPGFNPPGGLGGLPGLGGGVGETKVTAEFQAEQGTGQGKLSVTAKMSPGAHIYSMTQPKGATGFPTTIKLVEGAALEITGAFQADRDPLLVDHEGYSAKSEEYEGSVTWTAPVKFTAGGDPASLSFQVELHGLVCRDACMPVDKTVSATFAGFYEPPPPPSGEYRDDNSHVTLSGHVEPQVAAPGDTVKLVITAAPDAGYHIYAMEPQDPKTVNKPTLIVLKKLAGFTAGSPQASEKPIEKQTGIAQQPISRYYEKPVSWTVDLQVPADAKPGDHAIAGAMAYQLCQETNCSAPTAVEFAVDVPVAAKRVDGQVPLSLSKGSYSSVAKLAASTTSQTSASGGIDEDAIQANTNEQTKVSFGWAILMAFLGGLILNVMPCVLPVIGLKVMSFVHQAGESRIRIFALNAWYSAGLISVFLVLATLGVVWNVWAGILGNVIVGVAMAAVLFTMGLSMLGVWEVPIPGFAGHGQAGQLASREGPAGAFFKGVITTIMATPCTAPGMATALSWSGRSGQSPILIYIVFAVLGLGMASPYLLLGAVPSLVRFIPKPGAWMETFKQVMGFLLLGTVVFVLTFLDLEYIVPTVAFLFGLWLACWWIGRISATAELPVKIRGWLVAAAMASFVWVIAFGDSFNLGFVQFPGVYGLMTARVSSHIDRELSEQLEELGATTKVADNGKPANPFELPWQPYSEARLKELTAQNKTVLVDFTADWCVTCKALERNVLNTQPVRRAVDENRVVTLIADYTKRPEEITKMLGLLTNSQQVPVMAIFPSDNPNKPIVFAGGYTQGALLEAIKEAGPSKPNAADESMTAMNE